MSLNEKLWDLKTVTTADFAVKVELPEEVWTNWIKNERKIKKNKSDTGGTDQDHPNESSKYSFKDYVI